jgi:predicted phage-related endonuclease
MRTLNLTQGSPEWEAHRDKARNASDASAMKGESPYVSRTDLIRQYATGVKREIDAATQARFDRGHEVEPALVALAESIIGDELFAQVGVSDDGYLSASFDGVNYAGTIIAEVKQYNAEKVECINRGEIPAVDRWQIVQQFAVCDTAQKCIYLVGDGTANGTVHLEILREQIEADIPKLRAAWAQFDADVAAYQPEPAKAEVVAAPVEGFGALMLRVEGRVLASNLDAFKAGAEAFIARLPKPAELQTDQDFADADAAVKACAEAESRIKAAKDAALAQMADVEAVMRAADTIAETIRAARLALDKCVKAEKENRRAELISSGVDAVREHYASINATLAGFELGVPASLTSDIGAAIKGLKSLDSIRDKIGTAVAQAKIAASQEADRRRLCIAILPRPGELGGSLFPDAAALVASKSPEDLKNLINARIAQHESNLRKQAEEAAERERERIRREEESKARAAAATNTPPPELVRPAPAPAAAGLPPEPAPAAADRPGERIKLGDINAAIAPLKIDAAGLAALGFQPVGTEGAAKLYANLPKIITALICHLQAVAADHGNRRAA